MELRGVTSRHEWVTGEDAGDGVHRDHGVLDGRGVVAAVPQKAWVPASLRNSPEIFCGTFIMRMSRFGQVVPDILSAQCLSL